MTTDRLQDIGVSSMFSIQGKTALVTGGSRGIGAMIARGFVEAGARVYITARKEQACDATADALSSIGECVSVPCDIGTAEGRAALVAAVPDGSRRFEQSGFGHRAHGFEISMNYQCRCDGILP